MIELMAGHPFWFVVMAACVVWYSTITVYVAIRGAFDIKEMLRKLEQEHSQDQE